MLTEKQLQERKQYIGGSECAAIMGLSRWSTPLQVYLDKTSNKINQIDNEAIYWGNELEDKVAKEFEKRTGKKVIDKQETIYDKEYKFLAANLDRFIKGEEAFLECKTANQRKLGEWEDDIPQEYILQCMHYMMITGFKKGYIAVLIGGQKFLWKEIERDEGLIKTIREREIDFWLNFIEQKKMPMASSDDDIGLIYPTVEIEDIKQLDIKEENIQEIDRLKAEKKVIEDKISELENNIKLQIGEYESGKTENYLISWKEYEQKRINTQKIKGDGLFDKYSQISKYRRFSIKQLNKETENEQTKV